MSACTDQTIALPSFSSCVSRVGGLSVGAIVPGRSRRYCIRELIHCTSLNAVYVAVDLATRRPVIIKQRYQQSQAWQQSASGAFLEREGMVLDLLAQVPIPAPRRLETIHHDGYIYLVLTYTLGVTLETVGSSGRLSQLQAIRYMLDICRIVRHLHAIGYVHHDIKPVNCLVQKDGSVLVIDYGSAEHIRSYGRPLAPGTGTPAFMSLEQAAGEARISDDIFALGMTLAHLVPRPSRQLSNIMQRATAPLERRYPTVLDLQRDLVRLLNRGVRMRRQIALLRLCGAMLLRLLVVMVILFGLVHL